MCLIPAYLIVKYRLILLQDIYILYISPISKGINCQGMIFRNFDTINTF